jgi:hypothetical protein
MHRCLPCPEKKLVSSRLDGIWPPAAPRTNSVLGPIRHDMQEYYDLWQGSSRKKITANWLSLWINQRKIEGLPLPKCYDQKVHNLAMLEDFLIWI